MPMFAYLPLWETYRMDPAKHYSKMDCVTYNFRMAEHVRGRRLNILFCTASCHSCRDSSFPKGCEDARLPASVMLTLVPLSVTGELNGYRLHEHLRSI
jgi:hypothetical protein